jgi:SAM-dependent methyltransferase
MATCPICESSLAQARIVSPDRLHGTPGSFEVAVCEGCGAGITLPPSSPAELAGFYPDAYGPYARPSNPFVALASSVIRWWQGTLARRSPPLSALRDRAPGRGLDIGAGRGDLSSMLKARGWKMVAIEPSSAAASSARQRGLEARTGALGTVELERRHYDFAVFQHSLEHTINPLVDLRATHAALKPGGLVLVSVPNFGSWQSRRFRGSWYHLDVPRHRVHFTGEALHRALCEAGFVDVALYRSSSAVGLAASVQYRLVGRCLFPDGLRLRIAAGLCALTLPLTAVLDRLLGEGDTLHAVGRRAE